MRKGLLIIILILISISIANASFFDFFSSWFSSGPEIVSSYATPLKVYPGQELTVTAEVDSSRGIMHAIAKFHHESGFDDVPMTMIASSQSTDRYTYTAIWEVHDTLHEKWYDTDIIFTDSKGEIVDGSVRWQDPAVSHKAEEILPGNFSTGNFLFDGNLDVTGALDVTSTSTLGTSNLGSTSISAWQSQSLVANPGYAKIGSLLIQWGTVTAGVENTYTDNFATPFSTTPFMVVCTVNNPTGPGGDDGGCQFHSASTTQVTVIFNWFGLGDSSGTALNWIAIGR